MKTINEPIAPKKRRHNNNWYVRDGRYYSRGSRVADGEIGDYDGLDYDATTEQYAAKFWTLTRGLIALRLDRHDCMVLVVIDSMFPGCVVAGLQDGELVTSLRGVAPPKVNQDGSMTDDEKKEIQENYEMLFEVPCVFCHRPRCVENPDCSHNAAEWRKTCARWAANLLASPTVVAEPEPEPPPVPEPRSLLFSPRLSRAINAELGMGAKDLPAALRAVSRAEFCDHPGDRVALLLIGTTTRRPE